MADKIFSFQFKFACERVQIEHTNDEDVALATPSTNDDVKQFQLSPLAQEMQNRAREQVKHRRSASEIADDNESLHHLEVETINNTPEAKAKDRASLECLLLHTARIESYQHGLVTPARTSFWPPRQPRVIAIPKAHHFKGMDGTPLSFEPPFSTPGNTTGLGYESDNEFEIFLLRQRLLANAAAYYTAKCPKDNKFAALLQRSKSANNVPATENEEADSLSNLMTMVDQKEREENSLADATASPIPSPTSSIKHLPRRCLGSEDNLKAMSMGIADLTDEEETRLVSPPKPKYDDIDDVVRYGCETDWEDEGEEEGDNESVGSTAADLDGSDDSDGYQSSSDLGWQVV